MNETQVNHQLLATFAAVVEQGSFSKAARWLGVSKGTVSRSVARLEEELGVELLHRTTHHVTLSTAGETLYERVGSHLKALRRAVLDLPELGDEPSGVLRLTAPSEFGVIVLPSILASFTRRHPQVRFDIRLTGEHVDVAKEGYDLAIRLSTQTPKDASLKMRRAGKSTLYFYASPSYLARRGKPQSMSDGQHAWVVFSNIVAALGFDAEQVHFAVDDLFLARDLLRDGVGVGPLPDYVAREYVLEGLLEEVTLPQYQPVSGQLMLLYPSSGQVPRKVSAFCDHFIEAVRKRF